MTVLIICVILAILAVAASLSQINRQPDMMAEALADTYWWLVWPM